MQTFVSDELLQIVSGSFRDPSWLKKEVSLKLLEKDKDEDCWKNLLEPKSNHFYLTIKNLLYSGPRLAPSDWAFYLECLAYA